ncbi:MAG: hypothetical protein Q9216_000635 [Gyalolechia sp. 2 TL-2023]
MAENFVAEAFTLLAIGLVVIALRWLSRLLTVGFSKLAADDYLMIIAGALYSAETTVAYYVGAKWKGLANSGLTPEQRAAIDPQGEEHRLRVGGSKNQLVGWLTYTVLLWTLKFCMLIFYSRLTYAHGDSEANAEAFLPAGNLETAGGRLDNAQHLDRYLFDVGTVARKARI